MWITRPKTRESNDSVRSDGRHVSLCHVSSIGAMVTPLLSKALLKLYINSLEYKPLLLATLLTFWYILVAFFLYSNEFI